jgi:hypothetical protein
MQAERKTNDNKDIVHRKPSTIKSSSLLDRLLGRLWYKKSISDEGDLSDDIDSRQNSSDLLTNNKMSTPDIDTSHVNSIDERKSTDSTRNMIEHNLSTVMPTWMHDQVYGDKVS